MIRRVALALLLAVVALPALSPAPARADGIPVDAVDWKVDHPSRTITATVRLEFWSGAGQRWRRELEQEFISRIKKALESAWSGKKFRCYTVNVVVQANQKISTKPTTDPKTLDIELRSGVYFRSGVSSKAPDNYNSEKPEDRALSIHDNDPATRSVLWVAATHNAPRGFDDRAYAHEGAHILGLDDNYEEEGGGLRPGGLKDITYDHRKPVLPETIQKMIRRSGKVDEKSLRCGWEVDQDYGGVTLTGMHCGDIGGHWSLAWGGGAGGITVSGSLEFEVVPGPADQPHVATYTMTYQSTGPPSVVAAGLGVNGGGNASVTETASGAQLRVLDGAFAGAAFANAGGAGGNFGLGGAAGQATILAPFSEKCG